MINAILANHLFHTEDNEEKYDIEFYNEVAEMLRNDIGEIINVLSQMKNIHNIVTTVLSLVKLLRMIVPEKNTCLVACKKIIEIYEADVFDAKLFYKQMKKISSFDVNEYLFIDSKIE